MRIRQFFLCLGVVAAIPAGLLGCSTHPIPKSVTGLDVYDIVNRVTCEAGEAILNLVDSRGFRAHLAALDAYDSEIKSTSEAQKSPKYKLSGDFGTTFDEINEARHAIGIQIRSLISEIDALLATSSTDRSDKVAADALLIESERLLQRLAVVKADYAKATSLADISASIAAIRSKHHYDDLSDILKFEGHIAVFAFKFLVTETNDATLTGSVTWPIALGSFTLGFDAGDKKQRLADRRVTITASFGELIEKQRAGKCNNQVAHIDHHGLPLRYPITGNIGVEEVIREYLKIEKDGKFSGTDAYYDRIEFTTAINGALRPEAGLNRKIGQSSIILKPELKATRSDVHEVKLALSPPGKGAAGDAPTVVVFKRGIDLKVRSTGSSVLMEKPGAP